MTFFFMCTLAAEAKKDRGFSVSTVTVSEIHHIHCNAHELA